LDHELCFQPRGESRQALTHGYPWPVAEHSLRFADIGKGLLNITGLFWLVTNIRAAVESFLKQRNQLRNRRCCRLAEVKDLSASVRSSPADSTDNSTHYVIDIREVAPHRAVTIDFDRLAAKHSPSEFVNREIGPLSRPINGEEAERGYSDSVELVVGMRE
jgi:hypothetical protein